MRRLTATIAVFLSLFAVLATNSHAVIVGYSRVFGGSSAFRFEVVTAGADSFTLPIYNGGTYNCSVDWGDSSSSDITSWDDPDKTHNYAGAGTYDVVITGTITGWRFNNGGDKTLIHDISEWGPLQLGNNNGYFYGCSNLTISATDTLNLTGTTNLSLAFYGTTSLTTATNMNSWDVSSVTDMSWMFGASTFNDSLNSWDTSSVTTMSSMFNGNTSFNGNITSWDVSSVTDMSNMFINADAFNQDIGNWDVSAVTTMDSMFKNTALFNQDISSWNVSAVTDMDSMFEAGVFNQDISSWTTSSLTSLANTFSSNTAFNQDISSWDTADVTSMAGTFWATTSFDQNLAAWNVTSLTNATNMFNGVTLSTSNYSNILIGWEGQAVNNTVTFHGGNSLYSAGAAATARQALIDDHTWTITDGGQAP